jgi:hypothetical protein
MPDGEEFLDPYLDPETGILRNVNDRASRAASDQRNPGPLRAMFDQIVTPAPPARNRSKTWREAERQRVSFIKPS